MWFMLRNLVILILFRNLYLLCTSCIAWRKFNVVNSCISGNRVTFQWHLWGEVICSVFAPSVGHDHAPITSSVGWILLSGYDAKVKQVSWPTCRSIENMRRYMERKHSGALDQLWKNMKPYLKSPANSKNKNYVCIWNQFLISFV